MRIPSVLMTLFVFLIGVASTQNVDGQVRPASNVEQAEAEPIPARKRPNLMQELGLSQDQMQQIRALNMNRKPLMQEAHKKVLEANRALDMAIYADTVDEAAVQARLRDFQNAQAEVARLRFMNEVAVRKLLTPEQLVKFRELRRNFAEGRDGFRNRRGKPGNRQFRRMNRELRRIRGN